jgi:hypothetical protein
LGVIVTARKWMNKKWSVLNENFIFSLPTPGPLRHRAEFLSDAASLNPETARFNLDHTPGSPWQAFFSSLLYPRPTFSSPSKKKLSATARSVPATQPHPWL